ncbi:glycosyl transferase family 2 [Halospeciosus flavus]|uniref:Glycosyl transferase family 2 n=1 Tax=Halospeciosus flavus TaxID=3032283 RepID=A0ABD5Z5N9_9EURY|nr:glycosyl transferase family 2 [Halospeciosus flavus]
MDYTQERIATLHDYGEATPDAPVERATVVVPMTEREYAGLAAEGVLSELAAVGPGEVLVPLRAPAEKVPAFVEWLQSFDLPLSVLWCNGPNVDALLAEHDLAGTTGKGRDAWLALGLATAGERGHDREYVVLHDADTKTYSRRDVPKLLFPLCEGYDFVKGYYARVENRRLYGRLFRLFYEPLVETLRREHHADVLEYLGAFRYALAGESAMTTDVARSLRVPRKWGVEVGILGQTFDLAGFDATAQVDLGRYEHDHRAVSGPTGLSDMSEGVGRELLRGVEAAGVDPDYDTLAARYVETGERFVRQYADDAAFNGFDHDVAAEREQVHTYADAVAPPGEDTRLPAWRDAPIDPVDVRASAASDLESLGVDPSVVSPAGGEGPT